MKDGQRGCCENLGSSTRGETAEVEKYREKRKVQEEKQQKWRREVLEDERKYVNRWAED